MSVQLVLQRDKQTAPTPAIGLHAELLEELDLGARALIEIIELERIGVYDNLGAGFWVNTDSVLVAARRLVALAERRAAELRDVGIETINKTTTTDAS